MLPADNEGPGSRPRSRARQFTPAGFAASGRMHRLGKRESDQARAKQHKTGNGHSEETVRSEFITHGIPPIVRRCSNGTTVPSHSQKDSLPTSNFDAG